MCTLAVMSYLVVLLVASRLYHIYRLVRGSYMYIAAYILTSGAGLCSLQHCCRQPGGTVGLEESKGTGSSREQRACRLHGLHSALLLL